MSPNKNYYPLSIDLSSRNVIVIGGGAVAERKASLLVDYGAIVTLVSPEVTPGLTELMKNGKIVWLERAYLPKDLKGAFLVIAATSEKAVNRSIAEDARAQGRLVNVADQPDLCSFILPSVIRRGRLTVTISTNGASPALSRALRFKGETVFGPEYEEFCDLLAGLREKVLANVPNEKERREIFRALASDQLLELVKAGKSEEVELFVNRLLGNNQ